MKRMILALFVLYLVLALLSSCSTYFAAVPDNHGNLYVTYVKNFLFFSTSGIYLCEVSVEQIYCQEIKIEKVKQTQTSFSSQGHYKSATSIISKPLPQSSNDSYTKKQKITECQIEETITLKTFETLLDIMTRLADFVSRDVQVKMKDGVVKLGELLGVGSLNIIVATEQGKASLSLLEVESVSLCK